MATQVQFRGGTTVEHSTFTGASREVTVDTVKETLVVHDGSTAGGFPVLRQDGSNSSLALGSAASPSLKWDTNTGIYSPGADQVAISTNGTGRLFVDSSGNVGVGTSPANRLHVSSSGDVLRLDSSTTDAGILFFDSAGGSRIGTRSGGIIFDTGASERLRITSDGKVGLGTSSPGRILDIVGSPIARPIDNTTNAEDWFCVGGVTTTSDPRVALGIVVEDSVNNKYSLTLATQTDFSVGITEKVRITSAGNVGVGDTGPDSTLTIKAATGVTPFKVSGPSSEFAKIDSSGRLLVGTSSDSGGALLQVNGDRIRVGTAKTPASATDTGTAGEICWDANYVYVCTATNTWKRSALSTW